MPEWILVLLDNLHLQPKEVLRFLGFFVGTVILTTLVAAAVFVAAPPDFLSRSRRKKGPLGPRIAKNAAGILLIVAGIVLSLPVIPGPGFLVLFLGLLLVDFPWKRRIQQKIVGRPGVLKRVNSLRKLLHRPPLRLPAAARA